VTDPEWQKRSFMHEIMNAAARSAKVPMPRAALVPDASPDTVPDPEIEQQLARMLRSQRFVRAESQARLLAFLVEQKPKGLVPSEWDIGVKVFGRSSDWIPEEDAIVRVTLGRLNDTLADYYTHEGRSDRVVISIAVRTLVAENRRPALPTLPKSSGMLETSFIAARDAFFMSPGESVVRCVVTDDTPDIDWYHLDGDPFNPSLGNQIPLCRRYIDALEKPRRRTGFPDLDPKRLADKLAPKYFGQSKVAKAYGCAALAFHMGTRPYGEEPVHVRAMRLCDMIHYARHRFFEPLMHQLIQQAALPFLNRIDSIDPVPALRLGIQFTAMLEEAGYYDDAESALAFAGHVSRKAAPFGRGSLESYTLYRRRAQLIGERAPDDGRFDGLLRQAQEHAGDAPDRIINLEIVRAHRWLRQGSPEGLKRAHELLAPLVSAYSPSIFRNDRLTIPPGLAPAHLSEIFLLSSIAACRLRPGDWKRYANHTITSAKTLMQSDGHVLPTEYGTFVANTVEKANPKAARMLRLNPSELRPPLRDDARANIAVILKCLARLRLLEMRNSPSRG
jgi:hypothetical protein